MWKGVSDLRRALSASGPIDYTVKSEETDMESTGFIPVTDSEVERYKHTLETSMNDKIDAGMALYRCQEETQELLKTTSPEITELITQVSDETFREGDPPNTNAAGRTELKRLWGWKQSVGRRLNRKYWSGKQARQAKHVVEETSKIELDEVVLPYGYLKNRMRAYFDTHDFQPAGAELTIAFWLGCNDQYLYQIYGVLEEEGFKFERSSEGLTVLERPMSLEVKAEIEVLSQEYDEKLAAVNAELDELDLLKARLGVLNS